MFVAAATPSTNGKERLTEEQLAGLKTVQQGNKQKIMKGLEKTGNASSVNTINMQASKIAKALFLKDGIIFLPNALAMCVGGGFHDAVME